ncbi:hypothetical protein A1O1_06976, partial [Capronia coronata CBS 617.96]
MAWTMASPIMPLPPYETPSRSTSRCRRVQKTPNSSRRDKVRQGKLIRCWTGEEESYLFRSRNQKLPYKQIATRLDKSELACRLHYHHMMVGRKGHHIDECEDQTSEDGRSSSPPAMPTEVEAHTGLIYQATPGLEVRPVPSMTKSCTLPSFDAFLRDTFYRRSVSMPDSVSAMDDLVTGGETKKESHLSNSTRGIRTLSGTW